MPASMPFIGLLPSSQSYLAALNLRQFQPIGADQASALKMPSQTYDNVWVAGRGPKEAQRPLSPPTSASAVTAPAAPAWNSR